MANTASLKKTTRAGSRSVPNPLPDPARSSGAEVVAIERDQRITVYAILVRPVAAQSWAATMMRSQAGSLTSV